MTLYGVKNYGKSGVIASITRASGSTDVVFTVYNSGGISLSNGDSVTITLTDQKSEFHSLTAVRTVSSVTATTVTVNSTPPTTVPATRFTVTGFNSNTSAVNLTVNNTPGSETNGLGTVHETSDVGFYYGDSPTISTVQPFSALALDYDKVQVTWSQPKDSSIQRFRLLRNQLGVSDNAEDGVIILDLSSTDVQSQPAVQNKTDPIPSSVANGTIQTYGQYVYYSIWSLTTDGWIMLGNTRALLAKKHSPNTTLATFSGTSPNVVSSTTPLQLPKGTHQKLLGLLPRIYTSINQNPLDEIDERSDLAQFLYGVSYTLDELITYTDLLRPLSSLTNLSPELLNVKSYELGLSPDTRATTKFQRQLVRQANYIYNRKGTKLALNTWLESATGYDVTVNDSSNKMLTLQDSTFKQGIGNWKTYGNASLTYTTYTPTVALDSSLSDYKYVVDTQYCGKVVVSSSGASITNGNDLPITNGIPVSSSSYKFSAYIKSASAGNSVTLKVHWYDYKGTLISTSSGTSTSVPTSWTLISSGTVTRPSSSTSLSANAVYAAVEIVFSNAGTYYVDMVNFYEASYTGAYEEAGGVRATWSPSKINYLKDPSFEYSTLSTNWSTTGTASIVQGTAPSGVDSGVYQLSLDASSSASTISGTIVAGKYYTFSVYAKSAASGANNLTLSVTVDLPGKGTTTIPSDAQPLTTDWKRHQVSVYLPTGSSSTTIQCKVAVTSASFIDDCQLEQGTNASDYFDGSYATSAAGWSGTAHSSTSYLFSNKKYKLPRVQKEITQYLPMGSPYVVESAYGVEFKGIA
jgi:hypothetical protein